MYVRKNSIECECEYTYSGILQFHTEEEKLQYLQDEAYNRMCSTFSVRYEDIDPIRLREYRTYPYPIEEPFEEYYEEAK